MVVFINDFVGIKAIAFLKGIRRYLRQHKPAIYACFIRKDHS
jgi:hypothetical protein